MKLLILNMKSTQLIQELREIKKDVHFIKEHMFDPDTILTTEESRKLEQSLKELKAGKTTSLSKIKEEFGI